MPRRSDPRGSKEDPMMATQNSIPEPCQCPRSDEEITEEIMGLAMEGKSRMKVQQIGQWILQGHDVNACAGTTTLLDTACNYCFLPLLEALVSSPHLHLNHTDHLGRTPLMMASIWYDPFNGGTSEQAVDLLTSANTNCVLDYGAKDEDGKTALIHAAENKRWGSAVILLERFKLHDIRSLVTAMFLALEGGSIDVVRYMQKNYKERLEKVSLQTAASLYVDKMGFAT